MKFKTSSSMSASATNDSAPTEVTMFQTLLKFLVHDDPICDNTILIVMTQFVMTKIHTDQTPECV